MSTTLDTNTTVWPAVSYETQNWKRDPDDLVGVPKSRRRKILPTYQAAVPARIAGLDMAPTPELYARIADLTDSLARFDAEQAQRGYNLPALLLRSESSASSQIENLTSSVRNVALAELSDTAPSNARLIVGNLAAMRCALALDDNLSIDGIRAIHRELISHTGASFGGQLRKEQVWVGGSAYSPHGALFVPPAPERVTSCLEDLVAFAARCDINPIAKAALAHAQFETIHPFIDGNGRCGRTLLHKMLRLDGVLMHATLPVSAGLLHNIDAYMAAIKQYQAGNPLPVIEQLVDALELAVSLGAMVARRLDEVIAEWHESMTERAGSAILRLPDVLVEQPVVNSAYVALRLGITQRAATSLIERACSYGILRPIGNRMRGAYYQADDLIDVLEEISDMQGIRRVLASGKA